MEMLKTLGQMVSYWRPTMLPSPRIVKGESLPVVQVVVDKAESPNQSQSSYRKVVQLGLNGIDFGVEYQTEDGKWHPISSTYANVVVSSYWHVGHEHIYYDGPHCGFSLGFIHLNWSWGHCDRCEKDRTS